MQPVRRIGFGNEPNLFPEKHMSHRGKRYLQATQLVDRESTYSLEDAVRLLKSMKQARFDEALELAVQLGIDAKQSDQQVRGNISLPHGIGKTSTVAVFAEGEKAQQAQEAGADYVGGDDLAAKVEGGWTDFDVGLATPDIMRLVGRLGRHLGPRGLMPSPKSGTVTEDIAEAVREFKAGKVEFRNDNGGNVHVPVGRLSFREEQILENVRAMLDYLLRLKPPPAKGKYFKKIVLCSSMSPGVRVGI